MTRFVHWRKMTWVIVLWTAGLAAWLLSSGEVKTAIAAWLVGLVVLCVVWFGTRPLWRQGHGVRLRRLRAPLAAP